MTHLRTSVVKTRKEHRCDGCLYRYAKGVEMRVSVHADGRELLWSRICPTCMAVLDAAPPDAWEDGFGLGDVLDDPDWEATRLKIGGPEWIDKQVS